MSLVKCTSLGLQFVSWNIIGKAKQCYVISPHVSDNQHLCYLFLLNLKYINLSVFFFFLLNANAN
jgi:hypothetical protein